MNTRTITRISTAKSQRSAKGVDDQTDHLKTKLVRLDSDRRELFMTGEETKKKNNDIIDQLKRENKELKRLRDENLQNKRAVTPGLASGQMSRTGGFEVVTHEMKTEAFWKKKRDDLINMATKKKQQLIMLQDKLREVNEDKFGGADETPMMRTTRILENRLDKVMIKYNEAQSIRKTYEQIVKRLKEERVGYDNQLAAIERSLKGKEHDFEELLLLKHDACHAKELSQAELRKYEQKKSAVRELRETYLDDKKKAIQTKDDIIQKLERQEMDRADQNDTRNNLDASPDYHNGDRNNTDSNVTKQTLKDYEEAFRKLYEATGVSDVNDIIQKYTTQDETSKSLNDLKQEYLEKIEYLNNEKTRIKSELNALKYEAGENLSRKQFDEIENNVNSVSNKCERARFKYERVSKVLIAAKAGIEHLAHKLETHELPGKPTIPVSDETLVEALSQCVERLKIIYQEVQNDPLFHEEDNARAVSRPAPGTTIASKYIGESSSPVALGLYDKNIRSENIHKNMRVRPQDRDDDDITDGESDEDIDIEIHAKLKDKYNQHNTGAKAKLKRGLIAGSRNKF